MLRSLSAAFCLAGLTLAQTFQAEAGTLIGVTTSTTTSGYNGAGYVTGFDADADTVTVWPWITQAGSYSLTIRYSAPYGEKKTTILVNSATSGELTLPSCTGWCTISAGTITLGTGSVGVGLQSNWGYYDVDEFTIAYTGSGTGTVTSSPIDGSATAGAKALLKYMQKIYGSYYLSGQQDPASLLWVTQNVGKTPAILGSDFIEYSPSRVANGATSTAVEDAIAWDARGGINTFVWHWNAPTGLINTSGKEWWRGFYTDSTTFDVAAALNEGTSGTNYKLLLRDIDAIAVQIKRLSDANVPILFRPLHEPEGAWFWWGAKGSAAFKTLWSLVYTRLVSYHGLHNMVWVCNTADSNWYPGNSYCDIATVDIYTSAGDHSAQSGQYNTLKSLTGGSRVIALAEVGVIPDPDQMTSGGAPWAYWVTWNGDFVSGGSYNSLSFLNTVYNHAKVITLDELGSWKSTT
ncbi:beta-1,4-mannanase [Morchella snyderi]|nr:beta-1,4-mannanase [Morchella snyderi]